MLKTYKPDVFTLMAGTDNLAYWEWPGAVTQMRSVIELSTKVFPNLVREIVIA